MNAQERKSLAEQLDANPLWHEILEDIERRAIEALIHAKTENDRIEAQWRVRSARTFRQDCQSLIASNPARKGAPA